MKTESPAVTTADVVGVALLLVAAAAVTLTRCLLIPAAALLLALAGWGRRPAPQPAHRPAPPPPPALVPCPLALLAAEVEAGLAGVTVAQLRRRSRAAGLPRSLSHRGRRDALLAALAGADVALI
jgi:hypothetical protein